MKIDGPGKSFVEVVRHVVCRRNDHFTGLVDVAREAFFLHPGQAVAKATGSCKLRLYDHFAGAINVAPFGRLVITESDRDQTLRVTANQVKLGLNYELGLLVHKPPLAGLLVSDSHGSKAVRHYAYSIETLRGDHFSCRVYEAVFAGSRACPDEAGEVFGEVECCFVRPGANNQFAGLIDIAPPSANGD